MQISGRCGDGLEGGITKGHKGILRVMGVVSTVITVMVSQLFIQMDV